MVGENSSSFFKALIWALFFCAIALFLTATPNASARTVKAKIVVVNISGLGGGNKITDADLIGFGLAETKDNEKLFPKIGDLNLKSGGVSLSYSPGIAIPAGLLSFSGGLSPETRLEFNSIPKTERSGKYDVAVVGSDGSIKKYDKEVVIDNVKRTIKTYGAIDINGGDVVLLFVRDIKVIQFNSVIHEGTSTLLG